MPRRTPDDLPRDADETTLTIDHDRQEVFIWTDNRRIANKLRKIGAKMTWEGKGGWRFVMPESYVGLRKRRASGGFATRPAQKRETTAEQTVHVDPATGADFSEGLPRPEGE